MTWSFFLYKFLGAFITPPGFFSATAFLGGIFFLLKRDRGGEKRHGAAFFSFLLAFLIYFFSIPWTARMLLLPLEEPFSFDAPTPGGRAAVLVLAGGVWSLDDSRFFMSAETLQRFVAGVLIAENLGCPLMYTGGYPGKASEEQIREMVVRTARELKYEGLLLVEGKSRTTWENMVFSAPLLAELKVEDLFLVTTAYHLRRSVQFAERFFPEQRIHPYPSGRLEASDGSGPVDFLPSPSSFRNIGAAVREIIGSFAYAMLPVGTN